MPVLTKTRTELVNRAAKKLQIVASGQSLESEDFDSIDDVVDSTLADLSARHVITIGDDEEIPIEVFEFLADCLAYMVAPDFGIPRDEQKRLIAEDALKTAVATRPTYEVMVGEYF